MRSVLTGLLAAGMMLGSSPQLLAQTAAEVSGWKGITTDGYASFSYSYDANTPEPRVNQFRVFDFNDNEPQLDVAELVIQRAVSQPNQFGFRFDLLAGSGVPEVTAAYGMFRDRKTLVAHHVDIPQLYVRYVVPLGKGLSLDAGKFATHMGYEVIGGYDGYNDNFSRGFIFGYGIPFTHTGLRATYPFTSRISAMVSLTKGWDDVQSLNHGYTWGSQLNVATTKNTSVSFNFLHGPGRVNDVRDQRSAGEIVATWKATPRLSLAVDGLYGHEENAVAPGVDAIWKGIAGYAKYAVTKRFSLALRAERFRDGGGTRTGFDQGLSGFTFTSEYVLDAKLSKIDSRLKRADGKIALRGEVRIDTSNRDVFHKNLNGVSDQQVTGAVNLVYLF
jgi:hypothetical protein